MGGRGSGGGRSRSGPPPDPDALRRDRTTDAAGWTVLPAAGRPGRVPTWPLQPAATQRERKVWTTLWKSPQAVEWDRLDQQLLVGLYVRRLVEAESPGAAVTLTTVVRQLADGLGLTTAGMRANRWRIGDPVPAPGEDAQGDGPAVAPSRARLRVVDDSGDAS